MKKRPDNGAGREVREGLTPMRMTKVQ